MVASGTHYNSECCFDYGNAEVNNDDDGRGTMEAVSLSTHNDRGSGVGEGPWILADLEDGMYAASRQPGSAKSIRHEYVTAMLKGDSASADHPDGHFATKGGDAQAGELTVYYDGARPKGYSPMKKQGALILGIGGDNSDRGVGTFYEGVVARGFTSDATDAAIQKDIVAARYGTRPPTPTPAPPNPACNAAGCSVKWSWDAAGGGTCKLQRGNAMIPYSNSSGRGTQLASCTYSAPAPSGTVTVHQQLYCHVLAGGTPTVQAHTSWQNSNNDGDDDKGKSVDKGCSDSDPKYSGEGQCCFATSPPPPPGPPKPSPPSPPPSPCAAALQSLCKAAKAQGTVDCGQCAGKHAAALRKAGCTSKDIDRWCEQEYMY